MKTLFFTLIFSILISPASALAYRDYQSAPAHLRYNYMEDRFEYAHPQEQLRYNPIEDEWSYERPDSQLRYNPMENRFEYVD